MDKYYNATEYAPEVYTVQSVRKCEKWRRLRQVATDRKCIVGYYLIINC